MWTLWLLACGAIPPETPDGGLPPRAPGVVLLATLDGDDVDVDGTVAGELWIDLDTPDDTREAFQYQVLAADDTVLYERTTPGPMIVREFLAYWSGESGMDILAAVPQLGAFPLQVPLLDGAETVRFRIRGDDGEYADAGTYALSDADGDDVGPSDVVVGHETLHDGGPADNRLDVVLVGDGYTEAELADWHADAARQADALLTTPPLSAYADFVNIHRVDAISAESGVSYDSPDAQMRDTAFGSIFAIELVNRVMGTSYSARAIFQTEQHEVARAASVVPWDFVIVVANTEQYGGMAVHYATVTTAGDDWPDVGVHEFGHVLGLLGDEYMGDACIRSDALGLPGNVAADPTAPPWPAWIEDGTPLPTPDERAYNDVVGAYAEAYNCDDLYRPTRRCKMRDDVADPFCPVCAELLVRRLFRFVDPYDAIVTDGRDARLDGPRPEWTATWSVGGEVVAEGPLDEGVRLPRRGPGRDTLEITVTVPADEVRDDQGDLTDVTVWSYR